MSKRLSNMKFINKKNAALLDIFRKELITEKTYILEVLKRKMTFVAPKWANKDIVRACFETVFNCEVTNVNVLNTRPKTRTLRGRPCIQSTNKKFYVTVKDPSKILEAFINE